MDLTAHWKSAYESKYLGAWSLWSAKRGRYLEATVRIDRVTNDEVIGEGGRRSRPFQLWLSGSKGPLKVPMIVSNKSGTALHLMFGPTPGDWIGKTITLYVTISKRVQRGTGDVLTIRNTGANSQLRDRLIREEEAREAQPSAPSETPPMIADEDDDGPA